MNPPRIAVIGAGMIGVSTALELARQGAQVSLFESQRGLACGSSFQPGGLQSAALAAHWVAHGIGRPGWRHRTHQPRAGWRRTLADWQWLRRHWRWQSHVSLETRQRAMAELARLSQMHLRQLTQISEGDLESSLGLRWLADDSQAAQLQTLGQRLADWGMAHEAQDADTLALAEPGLQAGAKPPRVSWLAGDVIGNPRLTTQVMRELAERLGATFHFGATLKRLERTASGWLLQLSAEDNDAGQVASTAFAPTQPAWDARQGVETFDHVVICTRELDEGLLKHPLARQFRHVRAYSISAPIRDYDRAPRHGLYCQRHHLSVARLGHRIRAAGALRLEPQQSGHDPAADQKVYDMLYQQLESLLPGVAQTKQAQQWTGCVALLPDGLPAIGTLEPGLWVNIGHGMSGWSTGAGASRLLADKLMGRLPPDAASAFDPLRDFQPAG